MIYKPKIKLIVKMKLIYLIQLDILKKNINKRKGKYFLLLEKYHNTYQRLINLNNEKNNKILEYIKKI